MTDRDPKKEFPAFGAEAAKAPSGVPAEHKAETERFTGAAAPQTKRTTSPEKPKVRSARRSPSVVRQRRRERLAVAAAPFWRRFLADLIDLALVVGVAFSSFKLGLGAPEALPPRQFDWIDYTAQLLADHTEIFLPPFVLLCAIGVVYTVVARALMGATPGERLFGLSLLDLDGRPCSPFRAFFHAIGTILGLGLGLVGYGWAAVDLRRQGFAEYLSRTLLIYGRPSKD